MMMHPQKPGSRSYFQCKYIFFADGNEKTSQSSTDRNHNKILRTNYGCRTKGESDEVEVHTGAIANSIKTKIVAINDLTKTGDSGEAHEGSAEVRDAMTRIYHVVL